jgi:hypothetical protein
MTPEQALIRIYQQAAKTLRRQLAASLANGNVGTAAYQAKQLHAVELVLRALGQRTRGLAIAATAEPYIRAATAVDLATAGTFAAGFEFAGAHQRAAAVLAQNLATRLDDAVQLVGRRTDDAFRRVGLEAVSQGVAAGQTRRQVSSAIEDRLVREAVTDSLTGFVDRRGARWQLDTYAEMVARTTTREAMSVGTANRMRETGQQLVTISDHSTETEICKEWEGGTFALPGTVVEGYDTIPDLPPFHPRCMHVATPAAGNVERFLAALEA